MEDYPPNEVYFSISLSLSKPTNFSYYLFLSFSIFPEEGGTSLLDFVEGNHYCGQSNDSSSLSFALVERERGMVEGCCGSFDMAQG